MRGILFISLFFVSYDSSFAITRRASCEAALLDVPLYTLEKIPSKLPIVRNAEKPFALIDSVPDKEFGGTIYRIHVLSGIEQVSRDELSSHFKLWKKKKFADLGFFYDQKRNILYIPDQENLSLRMENYYQKQNIGFGLLPKKASQILSDKDFLAYSLENRFPYINPLRKDPVPHDAETHASGYILGSEAFIVHQERILFLSLLEKKIKPLVKKSQELRYFHQDILEKLKNEVVVRDTISGYLVADFIFYLETGNPERLEGRIRRLSAESTNEIKTELLRTAPKEARSLVEDTPSTDHHLNEIDFIHQLEKRFRN